MSEQETHYEGEICNLPVNEYAKELADGFFFRYTGEYSRIINYPTWGEYNGEIAFGKDNEPTWKLYAVPITTIPTPSDNL